MKTQKEYPLNNSPFYKLKSKKKLAELLFVNLRTLKNILYSPNNIKYRTFIQKGRKIQAPLYKLEQIHQRIFSLLSRIEKPGYLFSSKKGLSHIDNAKYHAEDTKELLSLDIEGFYRNSRKMYVAQFFNEKLKTSPDVADLLAGLCCYENMIPTGSPLSQLLAYWSYEKLFNDLNNLAIHHNMKFSLYVDDITFSSTIQLNPDGIIYRVNWLLKHVGLNLKKNKMKYYSAKKAKKVTGCIISQNNELKIPNKNRKKAIEKIREAKLYKNNDKMTRSALGSIASCQQIESNSFQNSLQQLKSAQ